MKKSLMVNRMMNGQSHRFHQAKYRISSSNIEKRLRLMSTSSNTSSWMGSITYKALVIAMGSMSPRYFRGRFPISDLFIELTRFGDITMEEAIEAVGRLEDEGRLRRSGNGKTLTYIVARPRQ